MRIAGIVAEYNPFHNGHKYHLDRTRAQTGCDYVVAVMDGCFTQRGEAAAFSKWTRVRMALACGVDAVFELPALYAVRPAEVFARAGVDILAGIGVDVLSFGSETEDITLLSRLADLRECEPPQLSQAVQARLRTGLPHARAWGEAAAEHLGVSPESLDRPNTILAVEYLRAIRKLRAPLEPCVVRRQGEYHDESMGEIASASAIRRALQIGDARVELAVPPQIRASLNEARGGHGLDDALLMRLRSMSPSEFSALADVSEGIERRLMKSSRDADGWQTLLDRVKCRRYTHARVSRLLAHALLGVTSDLCQSAPRPPFARLLGMRREAAPLLKELNRRAALPIVSDPQRLADSPVFALECRASDVWALSRNAPEERRAGREFTEKFIFV